MIEHIGEEELAAYIEGTIAPKIRPAIERHLAGCDRCLGDLADLAKILEKQVPVPDDLLKTALSRYPVGGKKAKRRLVLFPNRWALRIAALFSVAILLGYLLLVQHPPVVSLLKTPAVSDRGTIKADKPVPQPTDRERLSLSVPKPIQIEKKSLPRRPRPPAEPAKTAVQEKDEQRFSREEENVKKKEAFPVSQQVRIEAQKGRPAEEPAAKSGIRTQQDQAVGAAFRESAPPTIVIDGDVTLRDLENREILAEFIRFPGQLTARIAIDPQGKVIEVTIETSVAPEQKISLQVLIGKMKFTASGREVRYARLISGLAPDPK